MEEVTERQKWMAQKCIDCKLCSHARKKQKGFLYQLVKIESRICPFCKAYEKVYGVKAYEPSSD